MIVSKLRTLISDFRIHLAKKPNHQSWFKWEALMHFQENWDIDAPDFKEMYQRSLHSNLSRQLWRETSWEPKLKMLEFIDMEVDYVRMMFRDLLDESKASEARIARFLFYCDELMEMYRSKNPVSIETSHDHEDYRMVCLYLAFRYPEQYSLYHFKGFRKTLELVKAKDIPLTHDLSRYFKTSRIVHTFLEKEEGIFEMYTKQLQGNEFYPGNTMLAVHDFYEFIGNGL